jgi:phage minor structural protein
VTVFAHHITYRTTKMVVMPFTADSLSGALTGLRENSVTTCPFTFWTDKTVSAAFSVKEPVSMRSRLAGTEGSILDVFGTGEYEWDKFQIKLHLHRGSDTGVVVKYGKNITDIKKTTDATNLWTGVCPFWHGLDPDTQEELLITLPERAVYADTVDDYAYEMVIPLDLTAEYQEPPSVETLRARANTYIEANVARSMPTSIEVSFIALWQTEEYKDIAELQRLRLCDTLTVQYTKLGIRNTAKIVKTVYNVLLERYDSLTIGETKENLRG